MGKGINKNIDYRFKILYVFGILMVVCSHTNGGGISIFDAWFPYGGLHLNLFMFGSGYFYKQYSEDHIKRYIMKKIKTLIIPLYVYTIIYGAIVLFLKKRGFNIGGEFTLYNILVMPIINGHQFVYNMGGWFVVPLFMVEICNVVFRRLFRFFKVRMTEYSYFIFYIILGLSGNQLACTEYLNGWWLVLIRMLYFIPFYELGIFYKRIFEKYDAKIPNIWYFTFIFTIKLVIACIYKKMPIYTLSWCNDFTEGPIMPIIVGYLGIAFWFRIAVIVEPIIWKSKYINLIADNAYSIMMNQFFGFMIVKSIYAVTNCTYFIFRDFDWANYKNNIWWYYIPGGVEHTMILYVVAGVAFPIIIQKMINILGEGICKRITGDSRYNEKIKKFFII